MRFKTPRFFSKLASHRRFWIAFFLITLTGFLLPDPAALPVRDANSADWNKDSFWFYPWGKSGTHKGIDIFAPQGKEVLSDGYGIVTFAGELSAGGKVVLVLGPKWKMHYYAHLSEQNVFAGQIVRTGQVLGNVGTTGNAAGKPPHLHYSIKSIFPLPWLIQFDEQGYLRMFYLDPNKRYRDLIQDE